MKTHMLRKGSKGQSICGQPTLRVSIAPKLVQNIAFVDCKVCLRVHQQYAAADLRKAGSIADHHSLGAASQLGGDVSYVIPDTPMQRPSGQSVPWNQGFDWANDIGPHHTKETADAAEAWGYSFMGTEYEEFMKGVDYAQNEQQLEQEIS